MKLSKYFTLDEMTRSDTANAFNIDNTPDTASLINMVHLCDNILDQCRGFYSKPLTVTSGYRCLELNTKLNSKPTSQHVQGQAADIHIKGVDNMELAIFIRDNLVFDQLIAEKLDKNNGQAGWVHVSYNFLGGNRKNVLSYLGGGRYVKGLTN